jgi:hypothetical protein
MRFKSLRDCSRVVENGQEMSTQSSGKVGILNVTRARTVLGAPAFLNGGFAALDEFVVSRCGQKLLAFFVEGKVATWPVELPTDAQNRILDLFISPLYRFSI